MTVSLNKNINVNSQQKANKLNGTWTKKVALETPDVGIEPTTTRLKVERSSNWANRVSCLLNDYKYFETIILCLMDY